MSFHTEQIVKVIVKLNYKLCLVEFAVGSIPTHSAYIPCNHMLLIQQNIKRVYLEKYVMETLLQNVYSYL